MIIFNVQRAPVQVPLWKVGIACLGINLAVETFYPSAFGQGVRYYVVWCWRCLRFRALPKVQVVKGEAAHEGLRYVLAVANKDVKPEFRFRCFCEKTRGSVIGYNVDRP